VVQKQDAVVTIGEHGHARKQKHAFRGCVWEADALGEPTATKASVTTFAAVATGTDAAAPTLSVWPIIPFIDQSDLK
jgi:hypothetical protein